MGGKEEEEENKHWVVRIRKGSKMNARNKKENILSAVGNILHHHSLVIIPSLSSFLLVPFLLAVLHSYPKDSWEDEKLRGEKRERTVFIWRLVFLYCMKRRHFSFTRLSLHIFLLDLLSPILFSLQKRLFFKNVSFSPLTGVDSTRRRIRGNNSKG